ncbi:MAG: putative RNAP associated protein fused to zincin protease [crAssphage sp. isolate ctcc615]|uniref:RNAP associated protein fused to zincin protease n=1 Tax=crAssphage sp. isolate ctcc615 TaxID=2989853 RepID=A0A345BP29_9CAUD|nr:MAG: putative RNAP associated protein fused to zincin protease [crAssphage sp. isolate ctcc615]AXF52200.1 MAG: putative RNAP associated protein fused to zincin protease [crAssphage sp. isolate ctcc615]
MDIDSIFEAGGILVPNPKWSKSKKNTEPRYITVADLDNVKDIIGSAMADVAYRAAATGNQDILGTAEELDKYAKYGLTPNDFENLDKQLIDMQSNWTKVGNALAQTVVSELAIGTVKGFSDLVDLAGSIVGLSDEDYSNPVSKYLEEKQEEFRNYAPIYYDTDKHLTSGGLTDFGWLASNIPSVISSLTLLLPSGGLVKGASMLGKAVGVGARTRQAVRAMSGAKRRLDRAQALKEAGASVKAVEDAARLNRVQKFLTSNSTAKQTALFLENGTTAALSRSIENYQEARQTYNDMYAEASEHFKDDNNYIAFLEANQDKLKQAGVDINNKDEVAKYIATSAADRTFQLDWLNVVFDIIELYALRNAWKGMKNANGDPAKVRRENLNAAKYIGKSPEEIAAIKASRKFKEKAKDWVSDRIHGSKLLIGGQLSEGVEESINYIASEEGMHFGSVMLGKEIGTNKGVWENIFNGFDGRLVNYMQAPELYDSAFWGVMGGVIFQAGGSKLRQLSNKIKSGKSEANEESKSKLPWYSLDELPENKRRIVEIQARATDFNDYKAKLDRINSGEDIYKSTKDNPVIGITEEEKQIARDKLKDEFITKMTLRAMNAGNYDMLRSYLSDENLRKGFIESGMFGSPNENKSRAEIEQEATAYIEDALRRMERVERMYDEELVAIDHASSQIATEKGKFGRRQDLLAEYLQIIATNNVYARLAISNQEKDLNGVNSRIAELRTQFADKLDPNINYENNVRLGILTNTLGELRAQRKKIIESGDNLSNQISVKEIDKRIASIEKDLTDAELMYATEQSLKYIMNDDGSYKVVDTKEAFQYRDSLIVKRGEVAIGSIFFNDNKLFNGVSKRARTVVDDSVFGEFKVLEQDANSTFSRLKTISPELDNLYQRKAAITKSIDFMKNDIARTSDEVKDAAGVLHNTMNEARKNAINTAHDTITELYSKYGQDIREAISYTYYGDKEYYNKSITKLTESEKKRLSDALDVLALTKQHNQSLVGVLEGMFDMVDMINAAKEDVDGESSSTNSQANTDINSSDLNNNTEQVGQSNTKQASGQNGDVSEVTDPQETSNRKPAFYVRFYPGRNANSNKLIGSKKFASPNEGTVAAFDNGDGTYTLDVRNDVKKLNDTRFFGNTKEVDLTRPYEVVRKPIARRNAKGDLEIIQSGELRNTDTLEYQEEQSNLANENVEQNSQQTEQELTNGEQEVTDNGQEQTETTTEQVESTEQTEDNNLPTGEVDNQVSQQNNVSQNITEDVDILIETPNLVDEIRNKALGVFQAAYRANHDVDLDAIAKQIIDEHVKAGNDRATVEAAVNKSKEIIKRLIEKKKNNKPTTMESSIDEVIVEQVNPLTKAYQDAVKEMIHQYAKEFGLERHNGKYYVNLEDLLRFVNTISNDKTTAQFMFESLKSYLTTDDAKSDFIVMDESDLNNSNFINNVNKSVQDRYLERLNINSDQRVDINTIVNSLSDQKDIDAFYKVLDSLNTGDKLTYTVDNGRITIRTKEGKAVGTMPLPKINSSTGAYRTVNDGWVYDILPTNNGEVVSKLKDMFMKWFDAKTPDVKELNDILYEFVYSKPNSERKKELLEKFKNNNEIKLAKLNGFVASNASYEQLINGLYKLWKFKDCPTANVNGMQEINVMVSLERWFKDVLLPSYNGVMALANNPNMEIEISQISEGELIRISDSNTGENALPANKALAGGANPNVHKIAVGNNGSLTTSGMPNQPFVGIDNGRTFVIIPNKSGNNGYVQAYPVDVIDDSLGEDAKNIIKEIHNKINSLLNDYNNDPSEDTFNEIKEFITGLVFNRQSNPNSIFYNLVASDNGNNISITNHATGRKIVIVRGSNKLTITSPEFPAVTINGKSYNQKSISLNEPEAHRHVKELINSLRFNINTHLVSSDNNLGLQLNGILSRNKDGKFNITIGDKTWSYDSFNDFVLKNNLVRLNTKPNESGTSNYSRKGIRSQKGNAVLRIKINSPTSSPVEGNQSANQASTNSAAPTVNASAIPINTQIDTILTSDFKSDNKGLDIAKLVFDEQQLKMFETLGILPKNIIFDATFNTIKGQKHLNARVNTDTNEVTVGTKWVELFKNPNTRKEAIRKLIHEQLHIKLSEKKGYIESAREIYNEFKDYLDKSGVPADAHIRAYLFSSENPQIALEEFLVESLTSKELADYLNGIDADVTKKRGARNLFQKILDFMADLFGWSVREGSLYEKELHTLREVFSSNNNVKTTENVQTETVIEQVEITEAKVESKEEVQENTIIKPLDDTTNNPYGEDFVDDNLYEFDSSVTEEQNSTYSPEMISIKQQAIADGTFMKTPNGNPTNLNERQWLQVRTEAFKNWFGDWINNPSEASKVVDENGEPLVVYHESPSKFNIFDTTAKKHNIHKTDATFFSTEDRKGNGYGENIYECFINIRNMGESIYNENDSPKELRDKETALLEDKKYDGVKLNTFDKFGEEIQYAVKNSNQIKSATSNNGDFSTINDDIRYSSVTEVASNIPSVRSMQDRLTAEQQPKFASLVESAAIQSSCR